MEPGSNTFLFVASAWGLTAAAIVFLRVEIARRTVRARREAEALHGS
jgi:hypothetical protein